MLDKIKAVTFDARGTLLKVRFPVGDTYAAIAKRHGADISKEAIQAAFFEVFPSMPPLAFPPMRDEELVLREHGWWRTLVRRVVDSANQAVDDFDSFFEELYAIYRGAEAWKPHREAASVLCLLRSNRFKLGIISNFDSRIEEVLVALNLSIWFDSIVYASRAGVTKPDRAIFDRAIAELDVEPGQVLHVGDSVRKDWEGARAAGMQAILLDRTGQLQGRAPAGCEQIYSLEAVLERLGIGGFATFAQAHAS